VIKMGDFGYTFEQFDPTIHVKASIREVQISHKHAREIAKAISGMTTEAARDFLQAVIAKKRAVPFKRYKNQVGHKSDPGVMSGRYPEKSAERFIHLLNNLESNAEFKGFDVDSLRIISIASHKGIKIRRFIPRAMGRATPKNNILTHVEIVAREV